MEIAPMPNITKTENKKVTEFANKVVIKRAVTMKSYSATR